MEEDGDLRREADGQVVNNLLPHTIRSRVRPILTLRHSISSYSFRGRTRAATEPDPPARSDNVAPQLPPRPAYKAAADSPLRTPPPENTATDAPALARPLDDGGLVEPPPPQYTRLPPQGRTSAPGAHGISWKHARQGLQLLEASMAEAERRRHAAFDDDDDTYDAAFERRSFVDGLVYLAQALPRDTSADEAWPLERSLPPVLRDRHRDRRSVLHRAVQACVVLLILAVNCCAPFLVRAARAVLAFDRRWRVSSRAWARLMGLVAVVGATGLSVSAWLLNAAAAGAGTTGAAGAAAGAAVAVTGGVGGGSGGGGWDGGGPAVAAAAGAGEDVPRAPTTTTTTAAATITAAITSDGRLVGLAAGTAQWVVGGIASGVSDGAKEGLWKVRFNARDQATELNRLLGDRGRAA